MSKSTEKPSILLDLRCLQDPDYALRGVGRHALAILRHAPRGWRIAGLTDPSLPALLPEAREAVEAIYVNAYAASKAGTPLRPPACFVVLSPMTHDPLFSARLLSDPNVLRAAVVYDFIPRRFPDRYLSSPAERLGYALALRWLARCDLFAPISRSSADDLAGVLRVPERAVAVTGCPIDPAFEEVLPRAWNMPPRHLLVVGGGDWRKNPEVVIRAHARSRALQGSGIPLVVAGNYGAAQAQAFRALAVAAGGRAELVEVPGHLPDAALVEIYGSALALVSASHDEGFSIPVVEGMASGVPCFASDIPAHAELVTDPDCRFPVDDDAALRPKLERVAVDAGWRAALLAQQAGVWPRFRAPAVAKRFWDPVRQRLENCAPAVLRGHLPRVAMLSPLPPDKSGVADYTAAICAALGQLVDLHVFTEVARPSPLRSVASIRPLGELPHVGSGFDRVVNVVGNSHFHARIFEMLRRHGGGCIAHDARMLGFYRVILGQERALAAAAKELGRPVTEAELNVWLADEGELEALFLGEVAESAAPLIVHSPVTARLVRERHGIVPIFLPLGIYRPWEAEDFDTGARAAARARLGLSDREVAIATFGFVHSTKAPVECVRALDVLRGWGLPASLHFVGGTSNLPDDGSDLRALIASLGLSEHVRFAQDYVPEQTYKDYLIGADLGVQLRTYGLGGLSGALLDCAAAGLRTVTNAALGEAVGVPAGYVRSIPDALSPLLLAETLADLLETDVTAQRLDQRRTFSESRSLRSYTRGFCRALALEVTATTTGRATTVRAA